MNPRERFRTAMNHQEPDRVPIDFGRHVGSIHREAYLKLQGYLKELSLRNQDRILDRMAQNIILDESLLERFGVDFRWLIPNWVGVKELSKESCQDMWGDRLAVYRRDVWSCSFTLKRGEPIRSRKISLAEPS